MKRRFILVDTENVQNRWFELLGNLKEKDKIILFYTENHSKKLQDYFEVSRGGKRLRWVECISGEDALDYQLLGVLSYLIYIHPKAQYIIYSNDKGYKEAVRNWKDKGIRIKQAGFSTEKAKEPLAGNQKKQEKRAKQSLEKRQANMPEVDKCTWEIGKSLPFSEKAAYYSLLVDLLGQDRGKQQYQIIRGSEECLEILEECYCSLEDSEERTVCLIQTVLQYHALDKSYGQVIYQILQESDLNNLQAVKKKFDTMIGTGAEYQRYYSVMKRHFKVIKKMI